MKTFCLHHTDLPKRKEKLEKVFQREGLTVEWIEDFHPSTIDVSQLDLQHNLNINAISVYLKHQKCYELQKKNNHKNILILEDDIIIPEDFGFISFVDKCMVDFESLEGDLMFVGGAFDIKPPIIHPDQTVYTLPGFKSRCIHCYVVSHRCIDAILKTINIMDDAADWKLNKIIEENNLKVCYTEPSLKQATVEGLESSTIQHG
tara:strand:- start:2474 stop:3085 length:612 start_codon:yes stop_codon:yes gene_type:complete